MNDSPRQVIFRTARRLRLCMLKGLEGCRAVLLLLLLLCMATAQAATPMLSAGGEHTLALKADGTVWAWGNNDDGQLGDGTTTTRSTPVKVQLPVDVSFAVVSAGERFSLALSSTGDVYAWGYNGQGQLGKVPTGNVAANWTPAKINGLSGVTTIAAGLYHAVAVQGGFAWTWGANWSNQLGRSGTAHQYIPAQLSGASSVLSVAAGGAHTVALTSSGQVYFWGTRADGLAQNDTATPVLNSGVEELSAGRDHTLARLSTGGLVAWGSNWAGQLGDGTTVDQLSPVAVNTTGVVGTVLTLKAGGAHSLALVDNGSTQEVWGWGNNVVGQRGGVDGSNGANPLISVVPGVPTGAALAAGASHSAILMADGTVRAWGHDGNGRRSDGERVFRNAAQRLSLINLLAPAAASLTLAAGSPGSVGATFTLNSTVAGTAYWVVLNDSQRAPDYAAIKSRQDGALGAAVDGGSPTVSIGNTTLTTANVLAPKISYRLFVYVEPLGCNGSTGSGGCSNVASIDFTTSAGTADRPTAGTEAPTTAPAAPVAVTITDTTTTVSGTTGSTVSSTGTATGSSASAGSSGSSSASKVPVIEYFHADFGHYFITASASEIGLLDDGKFQGWARTGQGFNVHSSPASSDSAVCRFFSGASFSPKSSHFYTPSVAECEKVRQGGVWQYEADPFYVQQPVAGVCPAGTQGVYRLYNNGMGGAPNHRYLTSVTIREQMVAQGWIVEGVAFCADN